MREPLRPSPWSLRQRLLVLLLTAILIGVASQTAISYRVATAEANTVFDYSMQQTALSLRSGLPLTALPDDLSPYGDQVGFNFFVQLWTPDGIKLFSSSLEADLPAGTELGFSNVRVQGRRYRVYTLETPSQIIQVAQRMSVRTELASELAFRTILPVLLALPMLLLAIWWVVNRSLLPLEQTRRQVASRAADDLSPIQNDDLPQEIRPLVDEINLLFGRLKRAFEAQQYFVADAAHELRSPLTALRLQVQRLQRVTDVQDRDQALARLLAGIERASHLVDQMLTLARQESRLALPQLDAADVDLMDVVRLAVSDTLPAAQARGHEIGVDGPDLAPARGHAEPLRVMVRNLLENAVRYQSEQGRILVRVQRQTEPDGWWVVVEDAGPGIAEADRERAVERFTRGSHTETTGSGLGLAIVTAVLRQHLGRLELGQSQALGGLAARAWLPDQAARASGHSTGTQPK